MKQSLIIRLTFIVVILHSPASVVIAYVFGFNPEVWLEIWLKYVFFFIVAAIIIAIFGLALALNAKKSLE